MNFHLSIIIALFAHGCDANSTVESGNEPGTEGNSDKLPIAGQAAIPTGERLSGIQAPTEGTENSSDAEVSQEQSETSDNTQGKQTSNTNTSDDSDTNAVDNSQDTVGDSVVEIGSSSEEQGDSESMSTKDVSNTPITYSSTSEDSDDESDSTATIDDYGLSTAYTYKDDVKQILDKACVPCHGGFSNKKVSGDFVLDRLETVDGERGIQDMMERVAIRTANGTMPPSSYAHLMTDEERDILVEWANNNGQ